MYVIVVHVDAINIHTLYKKCRDAAHEDWLPFEISTYMYLQSRVEFSCHHNYYYHGYGEPSKNVVVPSVF